MLLSRCPCEFAGVMGGANRRSVTFEASYQQLMEALDLAGPAVCRLRGLFAQASAAGPPRVNPVAWRLRAGMAGRPLAHLPAKLVIGHDQRTGPARQQTHAATWTFPVRASTHAIRSEAGRCCS
jgi:hypothetical protein